MNPRKWPQANSIDATIVPLLSSQKSGTVLRCYRDVMTLQFAEHEVIHLVHPRLGNGPKRVVLNPYPFGPFITFKPGIRVKVHAAQLLIEPDVEIDLTQASVWQPKPLIKVEKEVAAFRQYLAYRSLQLKPLLVDPLRYEIASCQKKIQTFLSQPQFEHLSTILGLGSGSTPLGDDAMLGYILAQRFFGQDTSAIESWIHANQHLTTPLSVEMLTEALHGEYSEVFIEWLTSVQQQTSERLDLSIAQLGGNSGAMILNSFYATALFQLKEMHHANLFTYTR